MDPTKSALHRLLYDALVEIRAHANDTNGNLVFSLADVFHTVPLELDALDRDNVEVQHIRQHILASARRRGIEGWVELRLTAISHRHPETGPM